MQAITTKYPSRMSSVVFQSENHTWDKSQVEIVLGRTVLYYLKEERLVSLDILKLYWGEDMILQNPEDIDQDLWLDKEELSELLEIPLEEAEVRVQEPSEESYILNQT